MTEPNIGEKELEEVKLFLRELVDDSENGMERFMAWLYPDNPEKWPEFVFPYR